MNLSGESFGRVGIMLISAVYAAIGLKVTTIFSAKHFAIPTGVSATFVVCLSPLTIWQKHEKAITQKSRLLLPTALSALLESTS